MAIYHHPRPYCTMDQPQEKPASNATSPKMSPKTEPEAESGAAPAITTAPASTPAAAVPAPDAASVATPSATPVATSSAKEASTQAAPTTTAAPASDAPVATAPLATSVPPTVKPEESVPAPGPAGSASTTTASTSAVPTPVPATAPAPAVPAVAAPPSTGSAPPSTAGPSSASPAPPHPAPPASAPAPAHYHGSPPHQMHPGPVPGPRGSPAPPQQPQQHTPQPGAQPSPAGDIEHMHHMHLPPRNHSQTSVYRALNVTDALTYLDQVKIQFSDNPDVYNRFLDIMKDFKSHTLDTPGVISRVSNLFRGFPHLIEGFNTFLPPGYRIECSGDPSDPHPIKVTTPAGTTTGAEMGITQGQQPQPHLQQQTQQQQQQQQQGGPQQQQGGPQGGPQQGGPQGGPQGPPHMQHPHMQQHPHHPPPHGAPLYGPPSEQAAGQSLQQLSGVDNRASPSEPSRRSGAPVEFNHAINYVHKIKNRFADQEETYKHFLEILQTYQKEQKPIGEVYQQVTILFRNEPDLLDDFKQFLPDTSGEAAAYLEAVGQQQRLPPVGNFAPAYPGPVHQPSGTPGAATAPPPSTAAPSVKRKRSSVSEFPTEYSNIRGGAAAAAGAANKRKKEDSPSLLPTPSPLAPTSGNDALVEEISFFDRAKKHISNKAVYNEFLKILNLFSQGLIDKATLVERVEGFLGGSHELFAWFKKFVNYQEKPLHIENIVFKKSHLELSLCPPLGPSYRLLPKSERFMPCSGRDEMCWEVLNDEWVGHPTWASEDSGFVAHRKNQYEEVLHRVEEERHEYDYYIEANLRSIQTLETISNRIANMSHEERLNFRLQPGLGHGTTIYQKVIRKIYDKERGLEVIEALHENPGIAVPVVLRRLKQKDEEWRRAHREWNKVWRETEQKAFYKSLDHLGLTFKQLDKKMLTSKQLVAELAAARVDSNATPAAKKPLLGLKPVQQLDYDFKDYSVFGDVLKLVSVFLEHSSSYSANDREKLGVVMDGFLWLFFGYESESAKVEEFKEETEDKIDEDDKEAEARDKKEDDKKEESPIKVEEEKEMKDESKESTDAKDESKVSNDAKDESKESKDAKDDVPTTNGHSNGTAKIRPSLREILLKAKSRDNSPDAEDPSHPWIHTETPLNTSTPGKRHRFNLFANTTIYVFFRLLQTLYQRLVEVKALEETVSAEIASRTPVDFAVDLNLYDHKLDDMGLRFKSKNCYPQLLNLSCRLIEGDVEHQWFEEALRQAYRNRAYKLYTIDKVVQALVKHMHTVISDQKSNDIMLLFERDRLTPTSSVHQQILHRLQVKQVVDSDESLYRIEFDEKTGHVSIVYLSGEDESVSVVGASDEDKWKYYLTSYVMANPTEGVKSDKIRMPLLRRTLEDFESRDEEEDGHVHSDSIFETVEQNLLVRIALGSFKMFFVPGTEDCFVRKSVKTEPVKGETVRQQKFKAIQDGSSTFKQGLDQSQIDTLTSHFEAFKNGEVDELLVDIKTNSTSDTEDPNKTTEMVDGDKTEEVKEEDEGEKVETEKEDVEMKE
ncbi:Sin3 protein [Yarrowia lipolytica]|nr:Sin3 protein [Yarrowia lipolytica]KAE8172124.1 Sin3 protein [Yarrowia lipolytica]KAJ8053899.1 Sin3 protein [Yarrowia lipolytica]RDW46656.1 Sin3 protein [Yarrowia lipolytica]RDW53098.1 Sin3 protein [Yarrowia lipolytica]